MYYKSERSVNERERESGLQGGVGVREKAREKGGGREREREREACGIFSL